MSKLDDIINNLCTNGVPYKFLGDVAQIGTGSSNGNEAEESGDYPFFIRSQTVKSKSTYEYDEEAIIIPGEGGIGEIFHYINGKYALHQRVYRIHFTDKQINTRFVFYYMNAFFKRFILRKAVSATVTSIRKPMIESFLIPIPPLSVQEEIVRVLDGFTNLIVKLTEELTARKKQYEYYLESMILSCDNMMKIKLGEVCEIYDGTHQTPKYTNSGVKFVSVENIDDLYGSAKFISKEAFDKYKIKPQIGDVMMTRITAGIIGKCTIVDRDEPLAYYVSLALIRPNTEILDSRYLKYYIESGYGKKELRKYILTDANPPKINKDAIGKVCILIPGIEEQRRIVTLLYYFDTLCNDISQGIPAEIEARKKQYEYYRDKLLTFKELS